MFFRMVYKSGQIFLPFCQGSRVWQTDRRTDRQTDRRTEFSSLYRVCITCSAVKIVTRATKSSFVHWVEEFCVLSGCYFKKPSSIEMPLNMTAS